MSDAWTYGDIFAWYKKIQLGDHIGKTIVIYNSEERLIVNILYGEKIQMKILWNEERVNILKEFLFKW